MHRILITTTILLIALQSGTADVTPRQWDEKPHSLWHYQPLPDWNGRSLDEHLNTRVNSDNSGNVQNEQQACINPLDSNNFVAVWRDFRLGYRRVGVGYSLDGGQTWTDDLFPQMYYDWQSDPILVVDDQGVFTAMMISYVPGYGDNGLLQVSSHDGGITWQDSVWATLITDDSGFEDKEMLAVDTALASPFYGSYYTVWTHFFGEGGQFDSSHIWLTYKRPDQNYSAPVQLSSVRSVQWPNVAVGTNGEVYTSWVAYYREDQNFRSGIKFARSVDGGVSFTEEEIIRTTGFFGADIPPDLRIYSFGQMAVDHSTGPHRGRLYMTFTDAETLEETDVFLMYSDDHGDTWSEPRRVHDDNESYPVDQFHPWISIDEEGRVWTVFYDRRNDSQNLLMDVYFTVSEDGGETMLPNQRISEVSSDPGAGSLDAGLIGEYIGWCARGGNALAVWTDTRLGNQDCFASLIDSMYIDTTSSEADNVILQPASYALSVYPNPFNPSTTIHYELTRSSPVSLAVHDLLGRQVAELVNGTVPAGIHRLDWSCPDCATGMYLIVLQSPDHRAVHKALLIR